MKRRHNLRLRAVARYTDTQADTNGQSFSPPGFATDSPGSSTKAISKYGFVGADYDMLDGRWTHSLSAQGVDAKRDNTSSFVRTGGDKGTRVKASYATTFRIDSGAPDPQADRRLRLRARDLPEHQSARRLRGRHHQAGGPQQRLRRSSTT